MVRPGGDGVGRMRALFLALIALLVAQSCLTGFAAAHSAFGPCEGDAQFGAGGRHHLGTLLAKQHAAEPSAAHHPSRHVPSSGHDHMSECCGWMCTAALCANTASIAPRILQKSAAELRGSDAPASRFGIGLERPPKPTSGAV
jgi:hypothetical protein